MVRSIEREATPSVLSSTTRMRRGAEVRSSLSDDEYEPVVLWSNIGNCAVFPPSPGGAFLNGRMFPSRIGPHNALSLDSVQAVGLSPGQLRACQTVFAAFRSSTTQSRV